MRFKIYTLVDITETGQHRGPDKLATSQQANFNTIIQGVGLRANPTPLSVTLEKGKASDLDFGSEYKGSQNYWIMEFELDYGETTVEMLTEDFHLVPVITGLNETAKINIAVFDTKSEKNRNIYFEKVY